MPHLSVIMTAKNAAGTIGSAARSTLRALPQDAELLVLDDGSTDGTSAVVDALDDRRVRLTRSEQSVGYVAGRRRLLASADSPYVAIMDSDDLAFPWRFTLQLRALEGGLDLVVSPVVSFWTSPRRIRPGLPLAISPAAFGSYLAFGCPFSHPTLTMRRSALDRLGGYRDVVAEDYDLYVRASLAEMSIARTAVPVLAYRRHAGQTSNNDAYDRAAATDVRQQEALAQLRQQVCPQKSARGEDPCSVDQVVAEARGRGAGRVESHRLRAYASAARAGAVAR